MGIYIKAYISHKMFPNQQVVQDRNIKDKSSIFVKNINLSMTHLMQHWLHPNKHSLHGDLAKLCTLDKWVMPKLCMTRSVIHQQVQQTLMQRILDVNLRYQR